MSRTLRQRRERQRRAHARRNTTLLGLAVLGLLVLAGVAFGGFHYLKGDQPWPTTKTLKPGRIGQNSIVLDGTGQRMGVIQSDQNRTVIKSWGHLGKWAPIATVAIEDRRFYSHKGVDPEGIARAFTTNVKASDTRQGASTITQQVVRNLYSEIGNEKTMSRKAKEATLAVELEREWSKGTTRLEMKRRVLRTYLNLVFYGNNAYGIEAAAQTYFSRHARSLTLPQAAMLAGLPQAPTEYNPFRNKRDAIARRNEVLTSMYHQGSITKHQYDSALKSPLGLHPGRTYKVRRLPYFFDYVEQQLIGAYGSRAIRDGGLVIHTTINPRYQRLAEAAIRDTLNQPGDPSAAMVVIDTKTGEIRAMASSENYAASKFNRAAQAKRQPGSTAKIWALTALLKEGVDPETTFYTSRPFKVRYKGSTEWWEPKTDDGRYYGSESVATAVVRSDNSVFSQISMDLGPEKVAAAAHSLGVRSPLENVWSIALGSQVVTPLEQTNFYSTIARGGVRIDPRAVSKVIAPGGGAFRLRQAKPHRVLGDGQAAEILDILHRNILGGTGTGANFGWHESGKTGTTDDLKDAWFCGMTPQLTSCVWMGYNIPTPMRSVHGIEVFGGTFPATIWKRFMQPALEGKEDVPFPEPKNDPVYTNTFTPGAWMHNPALETTMGAAPKPGGTTAKPDAKDPTADPTTPTVGGVTKTTTPTATPTPTPAPAPAPTPAPAPAPAATPAPAPAPAPAG
jgi:penicillin-binding protein 1A